MKFHEHFSSSELTKVFLYTVHIVCIHILYPLTFDIILYHLHHYNIYSNCELS